MGAWQYFSADVWNDRKHIIIYLHNIFQFFKKLYKIAQIQIKHVFITLLLL